MKRIFSILFIYGLFVINITHAQTDSTNENKPQLKLSVNYNSNLNYYGRTDSLRSSGVFPMAELWITPKFYINAAPIFVTNKIAKMEYAGTVTTAGFQTVSDKWISNLYFLKPFYKESSQLVQSALKAQSGVSLTYLNKVMNLTAGGDVKFSDQTDFGATAGLDHIIRIQNSDNSVWVLDPSAYAYAGTQRFTNTYVKKKKGLLFLPGNEQQVTENVQQFNMLAYEFSMPIIYTKGKLQFAATPSYILPQNLMAASQRSSTAEKGENMFYATVGVKYSF
ncbi:MAG: hypothetical protein ICV65_05275 [Flavisolibacter sp.]|nr:hypothetical protein [Flavisolibacter sp.]MBD0350551.1 hypothetical protein [Flavisolibacter sp.]